MTIVQLKRHIDRKFATKKDLMALETRMNLGFADVSRRLDSLNAKMDSMFKQLARTIQQKDRLFDEHEERIRDLEALTGS